MQTRDDHGIIFQSYSSLAQGRLSGKYSVEDPPPKTYKFSSYSMKEFEPTWDVLKCITQIRGKPIAAVALNYNISKGALPVVGIRNLEMAKHVVEALGWRLSAEEVKELDAHNAEGKTTKLWQQG